MPNRFFVGSPLRHGLIVGRQVPLTFRTLAAGHLAAQRARSVLCRLTHPGGPHCKARRKKQPGRIGNNARVINNFFIRHSFKVILVVLFLLPVLSRGARKALMSNDNNVHDWLPTTYDETPDFAWFQQHFDNETFVLVSWEGCTLDDPRLELFAEKDRPPGCGPPLDAGPLQQAEPPKW